MSSSTLVAKKEEEDTPRHHHPDLNSSSLSPGTTQPSPPDTPSSTTALLSPATTTTTTTATASLVSTTINGKGLWRSWQRNFKTPLLALLDLFDNAIDATLVTTEDEFLTFDGKGQIHVFPDTTTTTTSKESMNDENDDDDDDDDETTMTDGLCIMNNCHSPLPPLEQILEVYRSTKGHTSIGENGVGTKQACASLTNLSWVLTKQPTKQRSSTILISIGVIAEQLQHDAGICFPHVEIEIEVGEEQTILINSRLQAKLMDIGTTNELFRPCLIEYGNGDLQHGIQRLLHHCTKLVLPAPKQELEDTPDDEDGKETSSTAFVNEPYVFLVVLHKLRHYDDDEEEDIHENNSDENEIISSYGTRANSMLKLLWRQLPKKYLHIPPNLQIKINGYRRRFQYWERRLVALTSFQVKIDKKKPYKANVIEWSNPTFTSNNHHQNCNTIFIHLGFDPERLMPDNNTKGKKRSPGAGDNGAAKLCIHSRQSGRLIRQYDDARRLLLFNATSSNFGQGLTILIDDFFGTIPLNPTKQDFGFNQEKTGKVHEENLFAWIGAYAYTYWTYHFKQYGEKKKLLSDMVKSKYEEVVKLQTSPDIEPLTRGDFTTFENLSWHLTVAGNIRRKNNKLLKRSVGKDSYIDLPPYTVPEKASTTTTPAPTAATFAISALQQAETDNDMINNNVVGDHSPQEQTSIPLADINNSTTTTIELGSTPSDADVIITDNNDCNGYGAASIPTTDQEQSANQDTIKQEYVIPKKRRTSPSVASTRIIINTSDHVIELLSSDESQDTTSNDDDVNLQTQPPPETPSSAEAFAIQQQQQQQQQNSRECVKQETDNHHVPFAAQRSIHRLRREIRTNCSQDLYDDAVEPCQTFWGEVGKLREEVYALQSNLNASQHHVNQLETEKSGQVDELRTQVHHMRSNLKDSDHCINQLKDELRAQDRYIERLIREKNILEQQLEDRFDHSNKRLRHHQH